MHAATGSMTPRLLAGLLTAVALAGCAVGPSYKRPDVIVDKEFKSQVGPSEAASIADLPWWQVFNDKALQGLITQAMEHNYDLQAAVARIDQARALVGVTKADLYPQVGYQAFGERERASFPPAKSDGNITYGAYGALLNASWELDLWGRVRHATDAASANLYAQEDIRRGIMLSLVSTVAAGYFNLIELDRELAIAQESSDTYRQTLDLFTLRFQSGKDSKLGVARAQANYDSSTAQMAALNRAIVQQENALSVLLGANPRTIERGIKLTEQVLPETPPGLTTDLLQRRPDILQAEEVMIGANAEIGVAMANYFPRIGLSALFGGQAGDINDIFKANFGIWSLGAGLTGPIFQGGRLKGQVHAQQAFWDETMAHYRNTVVVAFQETSDALIARQTLVGQRAALESQIASLREAVSLSMDRYNNGRASYFEVLEAEQLLFPSEDALAQTQRDQLVAVVSLYKALGGGWNLKDEQWAGPR